LKNVPHAAMAAIEALGVNPIEVAYVKGQNFQA
jgi:hypothetical protein